MLTFPPVRKPQSDSSGSSDSDSDSDLIGPPPPQYSDEHMKQGDTGSDDDEEEEASDADEDVSLIMWQMTDPWGRSCRLKGQTEKWILLQILSVRKSPLWDFINLKIL